MPPRQIPVRQMPMPHPEGSPHRGSPGPGRYSTGTMPTSMPGWQNQNSFGNNVASGARQIPVRQMASADGSREGSPMRTGMPAGREWSQPPQNSPNSQRFVNIPIARDNNDANGGLGPHGYGVGSGYRNSPAPQGYIPPNTQVPPKEIPVARDQADGVPRVSVGSPSQQPPISTEPIPMPMAEPVSQPIPMPMPPATQPEPPAPMPHISSPPSGPSEIPIGTPPVRLAGRLAAEEGSAKARSVSPAPAHLTPLEQISKIMDDLAQLEEKMKSFTGTKGSKDYLFLEEMITRLLLKLDNIDSEGKDEIRNARKQAVRNVNAALDHLELKSMANEAPEPSTNASGDGISNVSDTLTPC